MTIQANTTFVQSPTTATIQTVKGIPGTNGINGTNGTDGTDGADGDSAYQIWLDLGNTGSEADFIASLKGTTAIDDNVIAPTSTYSSTKIELILGDIEAIIDEINGV